ncbi:GNAT family N-acetyltransferase [Merismopedia glauca]|uniref:GNAT family N-acetyltransferase n=1 Tax=Merismopedia glauca CCAP 1448/3 TaxID=1296344 RepID=A0A2T1C6M5_9CYAN|nr:GNAT family N-acetyltransferase [Merismopedia glauca]PSB03793.1 GNAT family N-acetyltransferase [Merismopedia glauca CCAP 1448/3]
MIIRLFQESDAEQIALLFHQTVREINIRDYTSNQVKAWAPDNIYFTNWAKVCANKFTYVAENEGVIAGFGQLEGNGHIDCFYCHKDYQRMGIGKQIYQAIETKASQLKLHRLYVEASITAKPFFSHLGFQTVQQQEVECRGETFINYAMEKQL